MTKKIFCTLAASITTSLLFSCQAGSPVISALGEMSGFSLDSQMVTMKTKTSTTPFLVSGKCTQSLSDIQISMDGGATYASAQPFTTAFQNNCGSSGNFSMTINPAISSQFQIPMDAVSKTFLFRGISDFGVTSAEGLVLQVSLGDVQVTAGSVVINSGASGTLKARIVSSDAAQNTASSTFKFTGRITVK